MKSKALVAIIACLGLLAISVITIDDFSVANFLVANQEVTAEENNEEAAVESEQELEKKIAYVKMYQLFENHPWHDEAELEFEGEAERIREELEVRGVDLTDQERQQLLNEYEDYLTTLEQELIEEIITNINETIELLAKEKNILLVVDHSAVAYGGYDLTDDILARIDSDIDAEIDAEEFKESEGEIELEEELELDLELEE